MRAPDQLDDLTRTNGVLAVRSARLGVGVIFAGDQAHVSLVDPRVVYRASELRVIYDAAPIVTDDTLAVIQLAKRELGRSARLEAIRPLAPKPTNQAAPPATKETP